MISAINNENIIDAEIEQPAMDIKRFAKRYPTFSEGSLRHLAFNSETNGFDEAFIKIGRRRLILPKVFWHCVEKVGREKLNSTKEVKPAKDTKGSKYKGYRRRQ